MPAGRNFTNSGKVHQVAGAITESLRGFVEFSLHIAFPRERPPEITMILVVARLPPLD